MSHLYASALFTIP